MFSQAEVNKIIGKEEIKPKAIKKANINGFYIGVDPGVKGAISVFHESGTFITVHDMPVIVNKNGKKEVDGEALYSILLQYKILHAYVEKVGAMPGQGVTSMFSFGQSLGIIKGVLAGSEIKFTLITPQRWKNHFRLLKTEKDAAREKIIHLLPSSKDLFRRKKDCDRADACLIALCGMGHLRRAEAV